MLALCAGTSHATSESTFSLNITNSYAMNLIRLRRRLLIQIDRPEVRALHGFQQANVADRSVCHERSEYQSFFKEVILKMILS